MHLPLVFASLPLSGASAALADALIASVWQGILLTLFVALSLHLLPGLSSAARSAVWTTVLLLLVALPVLSLALPHAQLAGRSALHMEQTVSLALVGLWAAASAFRLVQLASSALRLGRILRRATPVVPSETTAALLQNGSRPVTLCASPDIDRPSVAGFFRPRILFPPELLSALTEAELGQIILHETEHLRRRDDWVNLTQQISLVLFPLNPALLWLNRRLSLERELACDEGVLQFTRARKAYAACLARVAENSLVRRSAALVLGVLGVQRRRPELTRRIERILGAPAHRMTRTRMRFATGAVLSGVLAGAAVLAHAPALVSFTPDAGTLAQGDSAVITALPVSHIEGNLPLARPTLVKAIMPSQPAPPTLHRAAAKISHLRRTRATAVRRPAPRSNAPFEVLTSWMQPASTPPLLPATSAPAAPQPSVATLRLTTVVIEDSQTWYTAVAFRDGWIVVQL